MKLKPMRNKFINRLKVELRELGVLGYVFLVFRFRFLVYSFLNLIFVACLCFTFGVCVCVYIFLCVSLI